MTTDLDSLPWDGAAPPTLNGATGRTCRRHSWADGSCARCGKALDHERSRQGKRNRRLGHDNERRLERIYGPEKIGELGSITDLRGAMFKYQAKAHRRRPPKEWVGIIAALEEVRDGRVPAIVLSFIVEGVGTWDFFVVPGAQPHKPNWWLDLHGRDENGWER